jgi:hypothetical protein
MSALPPISNEVYQAIADLLAGHSLNGTNPQGVDPAFRALLYELSKTPASARYALLAAYIRQRLYFSEPECSSFLQQVSRRKPGSPKQPVPGDVPSLRADLLPDPLPGTRGAFVESYVRYALTRAPMTPRLFHESAALWLASVAIARRLFLPLAYETLYPNLYVAWIAPTTLYHKTSALNLARGIGRCRFGHLFAPQEVTHESFLAELAGVAPSNFDDLPAELQARWMRSRDFAAQRGVCLDEMSGLLASAGRDYNQGLIESLLRLYDCDDEYTRSTRSQGYVTIAHAYFSLLGSSTPRGMADHLVAQRLWDMGWWPRWAILTPEAEPVYARSTQVAEPVEIGTTLAALLGKLPAATFEQPARPIAYEVDPRVLSLADRVSEEVGHRMPARELADDRLYGLYGRLPAQALKVAMLLAALDWAGAGSGPSASRPAITPEHYHSGLAVMESWRRSAHRALEAAQIGGNRETQDRILRLVLARHPRGLTLRELSKALRSKDRKAISDAVRALMESGEVAEEERAPGAGGGRPTTAYVGVTE